MLNKFAPIILTHGRADRVLTYKSLRKFGYTGPIYLLIDNEDKQAQEYIDKYGDEVKMFDKLAVSKTFDTGDNFDDRRAIVYARNASFEIARNLGLKYFMQLDDDYDSWEYKHNRDFEFKGRPIRNLDRIFEALLKYYVKSGALTIAMAQNGDYIGGGQSSFAKVLKPRRKCMNTFICDVDRPFQFVGRINEDVNTYTSLGQRGELLLTIPNVTIKQKQTQSNAGGMTDLYLDGGTYLKSFYSVMYSPSCVKVGSMGDAHKRLHHRVAWRNCVPEILKEDLKK